MLPLFDDATAKEKKTVEVLQGVDGWPIHWGKDLEHIRRLSDLYPEIDLYEEAVRWSAWMSEHKQKKEVKHRARFGNWCQRASEFARTARKSGRTHRRPESEGHGDSVRASRGW